MPVTFPHVPGIDVAGTVVGVGVDVTDYRAGDEVVAFLPPPRSGGIAELVLATVGNCLAHRPSGVDAVIGAALPAAGLTATSILRAIDPSRGR